MKFEVDDIAVRTVIDFWQYENKVDFSMHEHNAFEFHTIMCGSAELETDCGVVELEENDSAIILPGMFHRFVNQSNGSVVFSFVFYVDGAGRSSEAFLERARKQKGPVLFVQNKEIKENLKRIISLIYKDKPFSTDCIKAHFMLIFAEVFSCFVEGVSDYQKTTSSREDDMRTLIIEEYFNEFYMEKISLKKLSKYLFLSEKQTERIIKKSFGISFREKLSKIRLTNAKKMLEETELELRDIAEACGYSSYNGFYLAFKEKTKMTPMEYRKSFSNQ